MQQTSRLEANKSTLPKKRKLDRDKKNLLKEALKNAKIDLVELAEESGKSYRSVMYFFNGDSYSGQIHNAAIRLLNEKTTQQIKDVAEKQDLLNQLI